SSLRAASGCIRITEVSQSGLPRPRVRFGLIFFCGGARNLARDRVKRVLHAMPSNGREHKGRLSSRLLQSLSPLRERLLIEGVRLRERDDFFLLLDTAAVSFEFAPHRFVIGCNVG